MKRSVVIDASMALAWVHPSQATKESAALLSDVENGTKVVVPALWFLKTSNALLVLERRKKLTKEERSNALVRLGELNVTCDEPGYTAVFGRASELASKQGISVYDAAIWSFPLEENSLWLRLMLHSSPLPAARASN